MSAGAKYLLSLAAACACWVALYYLVLDAHTAAPYIDRTQAGGIVLSITNDARAWNLSYLDATGSNWVLYLTKWTGDRLDVVQLDLRTNSAHQLWRLESR